MELIGEVEDIIYYSEINFGIYRLDEYDFTVNKMP